MIVGVHVSNIDYYTDKLYDYVVPAVFEDKIKPGVRLVVPFGRGNKKIEAVVIKILNQSEIRALKPVLSILDDYIFTKENIEFANYIKENYFCALYDALKLMLPPGEGLKFVEKVFVNTSAVFDLNQAEREIFNFVKSNKGADRVLLDNTFKKDQSIINKLFSKNILVSNFQAQKQYGDKMFKTAKAVLNDELTAAYFSKSKRGMHKKIYDFLVKNQETSINEICYYTGCSPGVLKTMEKNGIIEILQRQAQKSYYNFNSLESGGEKIQLNECQLKSLDGLVSLAESNTAQAALLFGVTGSGKTLIYIELVKNIIKSGKTAIILLPEISLSPQAFMMFYSHFGKSVAMLHSKMSLGERRDEYKRIKNKEVNIVIGTRMAVFANLENLGVIIIDEEQEHTYKSEQPPRYNAVSLAKYRCAKNGALLVLGSATPSIQSYHNAKRGRYKLFRLNERYGGVKLPDVEIADMAKELKNGNTSALSRHLMLELKKNEKNNEQSILFFNRRGYSTFVSCIECGHVVKCRNCSIPLKLHKKNNRLMCHYCGYSRGNIELCPSCGDSFVKYLGTGTQKIEEQLFELFPKSKVLRMDADTTLRKRAHDEIINAFNRGKAQILVGTQMVAKGLDFENVTLVGVLNADMSLYADDFRASEITFSQITQVIGRAGRRKQRGRAVIQTFSPDNQIFEFCKTGDYDGFYNYEINLRKILIYPPFCDLATLMITSVYEDAADNMALELEKIIKQSLNSQDLVKVIILGPAKPLISRINNKYRNRIILKCKNNAAFRSFLRHVMFEFNKISKGKKAALTVDINPTSLV